MWVKNLVYNEVLTVSAPGSLRTEPVICAKCHEPGQLSLQPFVSAPPIILCPQCNLTIHTS